MKRLTLPILIGLLTLAGVALAATPRTVYNPATTSVDSTARGNALTADGKALNYYGPTLTVAAEAANVIAVGVTVENKAGTDAAISYTCSAEVFDAALLHGLVAAWTLAETGAGAEVSTTARPSLLFTTSAAGLATVSVTDVAGASGLTVYLRIECSAGSWPAWTAVTFDGA